MVYRFKKRSKKFWLICVATVSLLLVSSFNASSIEKDFLPPLQPHPLPTSLMQWDDVNNQGDYFASIETTPMGYLVWSQFPVTVYVEQPTNILDDSAETKRLLEWVAEVRGAIAEWNEYIPLQEIDRSESADIAILSSVVDRTAKLNPETGLYDIPRAITAQTTYKFYLQPSQILAHKMTVKISPELGRSATESAARHELGHALGIWGHSDRISDALYFSQVRDTPPISVRDINTLKKIYQQPTKLGWKVN